jgi:large subunit ribosomal protein L15
MLQLNKLINIKKKRKRVGRGGDRGGFSGRGHDGQKCRPGAGSEISAQFEGGQMPLSRRIPRRGFNNFSKKTYSLVNLSTLENKFSSGQEVTPELLREKGIIKGKKECFIKILGTGPLTKKLIIQADAFSKTAIQMIEKVGGKAVLAKEIGSGSITA